MAEAIDVQVLMQEIRDRIHQGSDTQQPGVLLPSAPPMPEMECLVRVSKALHLRKTLVGRLPPEPPTLRGRFGGLMVKVIRRSLAWFTSRLDDFHSDVIEAFDLQFSALNRLSSVTRQNLETVEFLKRKLAEETPADRLLELEARYRRLETAFHQMHSELSSQGMRISNPLDDAPRTMSLAAPAPSNGTPAKREQPRRIINIEAIRNHRLETVPYRWATVDNLFDPEGARRLTATYPRDHFKIVAGHDGEKGFEYQARSLIGMGSDAVADPDDLSEAWRVLAADLLSPEYRAAMSALTGHDLAEAPLEVNVFHYGPGCSLRAHKDLPDKIVTHVLYFNRSWNRSDGGCLSILRSKDLADRVAEILPVVGNSAVLVRSDESWHAVSRVVNESASSRRSVTVTFYRPGSVSTVWRPGDTAPLHRYQTADLG
jgi:SM-20-related protein